MRELLSFDLDGEPYALPIERVREIVRLRADHAGAARARAGAAA